MRNHLQRRTFVIAAAALLGLAVAPERASAGTASSTLTVRATVGQVCSVDSSVPLDFAAYDPNAAQTRTNAPISISCTTTGPITVEMSNGANFVDAGRRAMKGQSSGQFLGYELYRDSAYTLIWGAGANADVFNHPGGTVTRTVYGDIPTAQKVANDVYQDSVTVTVIF